MEQSERFVTRAESGPDGTPKLYRIYPNGRKVEVRAPTPAHRGRPEGPGAPAQPSRGNLEAPRAERAPVAADRSPDARRPTGAGAAKGGCAARPETSLLEALQIICVFAIWLVGAAFVLFLLYIPVHFIVKYW